MPFELTLPTPRRLSRRDEIAMLQQLRDPAPAVRLRQADLLIKLMRLDEAEEVLATLPQAMADPLLWQVFDTRQTQPATVAAAATLERMLGNPALTGEERDVLRANQAAIANRLGDRTRGEALLLELAEQVPLAEPTLGKIAHLPLSPDMARLLLQRHEAQLNRPQANTRTINTRILLQAKSGALEQARAECGVDRYLKVEQLLPADHPLNATAHAELAAARDLHYSAQRRPGRHLQRVQGLPEKGMVAIPALLELIAGAVRRYASEVASGPASAFAASVPAAAKLNVWAAIAGEEGHEGWHLHPAGWISGTYYIAMPQQRLDNAGAIEFGWPDRDPLVSHVPSSGELVMFPSYLMHQTVPLGTLAQHGPRIALTFDVVPVKPTPQGQSVL